MIQHIGLNCFRPSSVKLPPTPALITFTSTPKSFECGRGAACGTPNRILFTAYVTIFKLEFAMGNAVTKESHNGASPFLILSPVLSIVNSSTSILNKFPFLQQHLLQTLSFYRKLLPAQPPERCRSRWCKCPRRSFPRFWGWRNQRPAARRPRP